MRASASCDAWAQYNLGIKRTIRDDDDDDDLEFLPQDNLIEGLDDREDDGELTNSTETYQLLL